MLNEASFISLMPPNSRNSKCSDSQTFISYHSSLPIPLPPPPPPPHSVAQPPIKIIDKISSSKTKTKNSNKKKQKHKRSKSANHRNNSNKNQSKNLNQRVTSFSQNAYIPELSMFNIIKFSLKVTKLFISIIILKLIFGELDLFISIYKPF